MELVNGYCQQWRLRPSWWTWWAWWSLVSGTGSLVWVMRWAMSCAQSSCDTGRHFPSQNLVALMLCRRVHIPMQTSKTSKTSSSWCEAAVRNAGWVGSVLLMLFSSSAGLSFTAQAAAAFTLCEAGDPDPAGNADWRNWRYWRCRKECGLRPFWFPKARSSSELW